MLLEIKNKELYQKCIELKCLSVISNWLKEYKKSVASGTDLTLDEESINMNIIYLCEKMHLSINDLKNSKIGKNINSLGKALPEGSPLRKKCEEIIAKWKQMLNDDENQEENVQESEQNIAKNELEVTNTYNSNINNNNFLNNKTKRNSHNSNPLLSNLNTKANNMNLNVANNATNKINPPKIKTTPEKSCLKKVNTKSNKKVHFNDQNLIEVKIFKSTDEPNAPNISKEEYMKIQEEVKKNPHIFKIEEIRKKEITMDINQQKEPEISWKFPKKIILDKDIELELNEEGKESEEKKYIQDYCDSQLRVRYFDQIPEPLEIEKKAIMFSFTDENIPKIENSQIATKTNDVTINDVSEFWNNICQKNITQENINQLKELLAKTNDINNEKKKEILEGAQKNMNKKY